MAKMVESGRLSFCGGSRRPRPAQVNYPFRRAAPLEGMFLGIQNKLSKLYSGIFNPRGDTMRRLLRFETSSNLFVSE